MSIRKQRHIKFINDCECIVDYNQLEQAILSYQFRPTASVKHIYMHGLYPAVSIRKEKLHIHRLLAKYWSGGLIDPNMDVHHIDGNKLNASRNNLMLICRGEHQRKHIKGRKVSEATRRSIIESNHMRKGCRYKPRRRDVSARQVYQMHCDGLTINQISIALHMDWGCVKQRYNDFIYDNPELLKTE